MQVTAEGTGWGPTPLPPGTITDVNQIPPDLTGSIQIAATNIPESTGETIEAAQRRQDLAIAAAGTVKSVNSELPDSAGDVELTAFDIEETTGETIEAAQRRQDLAIAAAGTVRRVNQVDPNLNGNVELAAFNLLETTGETIEAAQRRQDLAIAAAGTVRSVNSIEPGSNGNVLLSSQEIIAVGGTVHQVLQDHRNQLANIPQVFEQELSFLDQEIQLLANSSVKFTEPQALTEPQKLQARENIAATDESWVIENVHGRGIMPDYANIETINRMPTVDTVWTADRDGFVKVTLTYQGSAFISTSVSLRINGIQVGLANGDPTQPIVDILPIRKGDVFTATQTVGNWTSTVHYIPPRPFVNVINDIPDYANIETINRISTNEGTWTVDRDGFVRCQMRAISNRTDIVSMGIEFIVNNQIIAYSRSPVTAQSLPKELASTFPVKRGDTVQIKGTGTQATFPTITCHYIPPHTIVHPTIQAGEVVLNTAQTLNTTQQAQARANINATPSGIGAATAAQGTNADNAVRFNAAQSLNATQKAQARANIDAESTTPREINMTGRNTLLSIFTEFGAGRYHITNLHASISDGPFSLTGRANSLIEFTGSTQMGTAILTIRASTATNRQLIRAVSSNAWWGTVWTCIDNYPTSPHLWPTGGAEINLGDGTYGRRYTGNLTAAVGVQTSTVVSSGNSSAWAPMAMGGWWNSGASTRCMVGSTNSGTGNTIGNSSAFFFDAGGVHFQTVSATARTTAHPFDVWIRYTR